jgi:hypothetical protein
MGLGLELFQKNIEHAFSPYRIYIPPLSWREIYQIPKQTGYVQLVYGVDFLYEDIHFRITYQPDAMYWYLYEIRRGSEEYPIIQLETELKQIVNYIGNLTSNP